MSGSGGGPGGSNTFISNDGTDKAEDESKANLGSFINQPIGETPMKNQTVIFKLGMIIRQKIATQVF